MYHSSDEYHSENSEESPVEEMNELKTSGTSSKEFAGPCHSFYLNQIRSKPNGGYIDVIHKEWFGDYELLEDHHGFIQWIFPLFEIGVNYSAPPLNKAECEAMRVDKCVTQRLIQSYRMMLDFYGLELVNEETGEVKPVDNEDKRRSRFQNLQWHTHNFLRMTRILHSLGFLGLEHYKAPLMDTWIEVVFRQGKIQSCRSSLQNFWLKTLRQDEQRFFEKKLESISKASSAVGEKKDEKSAFGKYVDRVKDRFSGSGFSQSSQESGMEEGPIQTQHTAESDCEESSPAQPSSSSLPEPPAPAPLPSAPLPTPRCMCAEPELARLSATPSGERFWVCSKARKCNFFLWEKYTHLATRYVLPAAHTSVRANPRKASSQ